MSCDFWQVSDFYGKVTLNLYLIGALSDYFVVAMFWTSLSCLLITFHSDLENSMQQLLFSEVSPLT